MFNIVAALPVGKNVAATLAGICDIKQGAKFKDENQKEFEVVSVGVAQYDDPCDITKYTEVLLHPLDNTVHIGHSIYPI